MASVASITAQPGGMYLLRIRDWYRNVKEIPIAARTIKIRNGSQEVLAFDGTCELEERHDWQAGYSFRVAGVVSQAGALEGTMVEFWPPGFRGAQTEAVVVRKFKLRSLDAEKSSAAQPTTAPSSKAEAGRNSEPAPKIIESPAVDLPR